MLPFLKPKKVVGVIMAKVTKDGSLEISHEEGTPPPEMIECAEGLLKAIAQKDATAVAEHLISAAHIADAMPHEEGEHEDIGEEED